MRDLHYHPEQTAQGAGLDELRREKLTWIERSPTSGPQRRERFEALRDLTARLRVPLEGEERRLRDELSRCERSLAANAVLQRRDYAFCLYPEASLRPFLTQVL